MAFDSDKFDIPTEMLTVSDVHALLDTPGMPEKIVLEKIRSIGLLLMNSDFRGGPHEAALAGLEEACRGTVLVDERPFLETTRSFIRTILSGVDEDMSIQGFLKNRRESSENAIHSFSRNAQPDPHLDGVIDELIAIHENDDFEVLRDVVQDVRDHGVLEEGVSGHFGMNGRLGKELLTRIEREIPRDPGEACRWLIHGLGCMGRPRDLPAIHTVPTELMTYINAAGDEGEMVFEEDEEDEDACPCCGRS